MNKGVDMVKTFWYKPDFWMNYDRVGDNKQTLDMWINTIEKDYFAKFIQVVKQKENGDTMCLFKLRKPRILAKNKLHFEKSSFDVHFGKLHPFRGKQTSNNDQKFCLE